MNLNNPALPRMISYVSEGENHRTVVPRISNRAIHFPFSDGDEISLTHTYFNIKVQCCENYATRIFSTTFFIYLFKKGINKRD